MELTEWIISIALILVVIRQIRGRKLTRMGLLWPVPLVVWGAIRYVGEIPAHEPDWAFVSACVMAGLALGVGCGLLTEVYLEAGTVTARARWLAAALWIVGMGSRLTFGLVATNGGAKQVSELSAQLGIHSASTWASGLVAMALIEVVARSAVLLFRSSHLRRIAAAFGQHAAQRPTVPTQVMK